MIKYSTYKKIRHLFYSASLRLLCAFFTAVLILGAYACGGEDKPEPEISEAPVSEEVYEEAHREDEYQTDTQYEHRVSEGLRNLPNIPAIKIVTVGPDVREGFKVEVKTTNTGAGDIDFIYEWKINGEEILGLTDQVIEWQEAFRKGDTLSVTVIPVSEAGRGSWAIESSMIILNSPPQIISEPSELFDDGKFNYKVEALDPDGDSFDFTLRGAPKGMIIEPATGLITWQYDVKDSGDYEVQIIVTDSEGAQSLQTLTFTIHPEGSSPENLP